MYSLIILLYRRFVRRNKLPLSPPIFTIKRVNRPFIQQKPKVMEALNRFESSVKTNAALKKTSVSAQEVITENIVYIQKGEYESYTFAMTDDGSGDVRNLVLEKNKTGNYKSYLFKYQLNEADKQAILNGNLSVAIGKTTIEETDNPISSMAKIGDDYQPCSFSVEIRYTVCSENKHFHGETYLTCEATFISVPYEYILYMNCGSEGIPGPGTGTPIGGTNPVTGIPGQGGGGNGSGSNNNGSNPDDNGNSNGNNNSEPVSNINDGTTITLPNIDRNNKTDCQVLAEQGNITKIKSKIDSISTLAMNHDTQESNISVRRGSNNGVYEYSFYQNRGTPDEVKNEVYKNSILIMHNHLDNHFQFPSHKDIVTFYILFNYVLNKNDFTSYITMNNGRVYAIRADNIDGLAILFDGLNLETENGRNEAYNKIMKIYKSHGFDDKKTYTTSELEQIFMKVISCDNRLSGLKFFQRVGPNTWNRLTFDQTTGEVNTQGCN